MTRDEEIELLSELTRLYGARRVNESPRLKIGRYKRLQRRRQYDQQIRSVLRRMLNDERRIQLHEERGSRGVSDLPTAYRTSRC